MNQYSAACWRYCLIFVVAVSLNCSAIAATEFKIISLQYRFAEEILPAIIPLIGKDGTASAMQNNLIIRTNPANMAEIERIIRTLDTARQNLKITVMLNKDSISNDSSAEASVRKRNGNLTIASGNSQMLRDSVALSIENQQHKSNASTTQFIQVIDGEQAFISVGQSIPYTQEWINLAQRYASVQRTTEFVNIDTGFAVRPRAVGNQIVLEITPRFSQLNQHGTIDFETLSTTIRAARGEWINIADIMQHRDDVSRAIISARSNNQSLNSQILVRVE